MAGEATRRREGTVRRVAAATETKHSSKTTEFYAMIGVIAAILIAAWYVGRNGGTDTLRASDAWLYISIVASAYMISRGLAKSGSHEPRTDDVDRR
jgi:flagellar biogenesis protein FliO